MTRHLLITGGCGFIGSNFVRFIRQTRPDWRLTNVDVLTYSGNLENLEDLTESDDRYRFVKGDICDRAVLHPLITEADAVVHLAAESHVDRSILDSRPFVQTNVLGTQTLLDALRRAQANDGRPRRFVYVSTDEVYGSLPLDDPDNKFTEQTPLDPRSPYAASKAAGDQMTLAYFHTFGMDVAVTRCSNNLGPYQFPEKVIPLFVTNLMDGEKVPLYGDGKNVRDWIHVDDHCEALLAVLERGQAGEVYNVGGNNERSNIELTLAILELMGCGKEMITYVKDRPGHDRRYAIDASKIEADLGWKPTRSAWPEALRETVDWYRANRTWWERVKSGAYRDYYKQQYGARIGAACACED
ncbi:MAG: dTDP-glucose 4,6-dehydratase [Planctomycetes bacterium]|nr:dTDP-glucose 4,6-dehydratase [Planctomycetota bacterium]NOG53999.1 dTDP-glucose 4,6-dehydratase [Planctomycetota bacterium]